MATNHAVGNGRPLADRFGYRGGNDKVVNAEIIAGQVCAIQRLGMSRSSLASRNHHRAHSHGALPLQSHLISSLEHQAAQQIVM
tara:strand:- start:68 stop:319 length:252 start_codon:yes stop_codon:yes gene_type:complete